MTTDPIAFLENTLPAVFTKGVASLRTKADAGDAVAKLRLDDCVSVVGAGVMVLDGAGTIYLTAREGTLTAGRDKPDAPIRIAVGCEADALEVALGEAAKESALDDPRVIEAVPALASKRLETLLNGRKLTCHLLVKDHPELGDVTVKLGFNVEEPPEKPGFTAELKHEDLEAIRSGSIDLQKVFMAGKLRLKGDYSVALQIAMQLAQEAQAAAKKK